MARHRSWNLHPVPYCPVWSGFPSIASINFRAAMKHIKESDHGHVVLCNLGRKIPGRIRFRCSSEDDGLLPLLVLNRSYAERVRAVFRVLPDCIFLFLCIMALGFLAPAAEDDIISDIRSARHELGLDLAQSLQRYNEVSSQWTVQ